MIHLKKFGIYRKRSCFNYDTGKDIYFIIIFLSLYYIQLKITAVILEDYATQWELGRLIKDKRERHTCIESREKIGTKLVVTSLGSLVFENVFYLLYVAFLVG